MIDGGGSNPRPFRGKEQWMVGVGVRVTRATRDRLQQLALERGVTLSAYINDVITEHLSGLDKKTKK